MLELFGYQFPLPPELQFLASPLGSFLATALVWLLIGIAAYLLLTYGFRWLTRRIPGDIDDIILATVRKPLLVLLFVFGTLNDLEVLHLRPDFIASFERVLNTVLAGIIVILLLKLIFSVVGYYGDTYAKITETRLDDVLVPIIELVGPILVILTALVLVLSQWGIDLTTILAGAGVISLVLGLAVQEPLKNIFSGISSIYRYEPVHDCIVQAIHRHLLKLFQRPVDFLAESYWVELLDVGFWAF